MTALLPTLLLCWYIYEKDRVEKEPFGLLSLLFLAGGIGFLPAFFLQRDFAAHLDGWFAAHLSFSVEGTALFDSVGAQLGHAALFGFVGVALVENCVKWLVLCGLTRKSRHFNSLFDGLIYACFVSLGFAAFESVCFAWQNGWDTLLLRLATALPCHLLIGVLMGYGYTISHTVRVAKQTEQRLIQNGVLAVAKVRGEKRWLAASFLAPFFIQGVYVLSGSFHSVLVETLFYIAVALLFVACFVGIHLLSDKDQPTEKSSCTLLVRRHPEVDAASLRQAVAAEVPYEQ